MVFIHFSVFSHIFPNIYTMRYLNNVEQIISKSIPGWLTEVYYLKVSHAFMLCIGRFMEDSSPCSLSYIIEGWQDKNMWSQTHSIQFDKHSLVIKHFSGSEFRQYACCAMSKHCSTLWISMSTAWFFFFIFFAGIFFSGMKWVCFCSGVNCVSGTHFMVSLVCSY